MRQRIIYLEKAKKSVIAMELYFNNDPSNGQFFGGDE